METILYEGSTRYIGPYSHQGFANIINPLIDNGMVPALIPTGYKREKDIKFDATEANPNIEASHWALEGGVIASYVEKTWNGIGRLEGKTKISVHGPKKPVKALDLILREEIEKITKKGIV